MESKYKRLKSLGQLNCWDFYCKQKVEQGWTLINRFKYHERVLQLKDENGVVIETITYEDFSIITKAIFQRVVQYLILGEPYHLNHQNGLLKARRVECRYTEKNWTKSGEKEFWSEDYCIINWNRANDKIISPEKYNQLSKFTFVIARDNNGTGFKDRFKEAREANPILKYSYDFIPSSSLL